MTDREAFEAFEQQRTELRNALYPGGIKHPQQAEWPWLIERAKEQREALVKASEKLTSRALDIGDHYWIPIDDYEEAIAAIDAVL